MQRWMRTLRTVGLAPVAALVLACATTGVVDTKVDYNRDFDFEGVRKVALLPYQRSNPTEVLLTDDRAALVSLSLAKVLVAKGYQVVQERSEADAWLSWHLVGSDDDAAGGEERVSLYECWRCGPAIADTELPRYTEGTLIVELVDPVEIRSVWRAVARTRLKPRPERALDEKARDEAARQVLADFPPEPPAAD